MTQILVLCVGNSLDSRRDVRNPTVTGKLFVSRFIDMHIWLEHLALRPRNNIATPSVVI